MPTGFDKFRKKTLDESPIKINTPSDFNGEPEDDARNGRGETAAQHAGRQETAQPETAARGTAGRKTSVKKEERSLVNFMAQISPETKTKIDEMRYRLKRKNWEIVDEAVKDLYDKYFKR